MILQLTEEDSRRLRERAEVEGTSEDDVALTAIRKYLGTKTPAGSSGDPVTEVKGLYASSLRRLGE